MAGVLGFTLGMKDVGFMGTTGAATAGLQRMLGVGTALAASLGAITGLGAGVAGVFREIKEGGRLLDLGARLQESAGSLFKLEHGFAQIGEGAASVAPVLTAVNKSLGGLNEQGEPTAEIFQRIGLSIEDLTKLNAEDKLLAIGSALRKLPKEQQVNFAAQIAGRGGATALVAIANSTQEFADALGQAGPQAAIMARNAVAFDKIGKTLDRIKLQGRGLFLGVAEGAAPGIQMALDEIKKIDLTSIGKKIGHEIGLIGAAFKNGQLGELLSLELSAGFTKAVVFANSLFRNPDLGMGMAQGLIAGLAPLGKALLSLSSMFQDAMTSSLVKIAADGIEKFGGPKAPAFKNIFADKRKASLAADAAIFGTPDEFMAEVLGFAKDAGKNIGGALKAAREEAAGAGGDDAIKLAALRAQLFAGIGSPLNNLGRDKNDPALNPGPDFSKAGKGNGGASKLDLNSLERIGGIFTGGHRNPVADYTRRAADGIGVTNQLLRTLVTQATRPAWYEQQPIDPWAHAD